MASIRISLKNSDVGALATQNLTKQSYENLPNASINKLKKKFQVLSTDEMGISTKGVLNGERQQQMQTKQNKTEQNTLNAKETKLLIFMC